MEQPASVVLPQRHTRMSPGVAGQRHHQDLGRQSVQIAHRVEAEPALAARAVALPALHIVELPRPPTVARDDAGTRTGGVVIFALHDVDGGVREVLQPAGMIEVEMRRDDVPHVAGTMAARLDLSDRRVAFVEPDVEHHPPWQGDPGIGAVVRMRDVAQAVTGVDQHQPVRVGFDQQTMTDDPPQGAKTAPVEQCTVERTVCSAVQMENSHRAPPARP
ncbi:MAG: hypothetical protein PGN12_07025 [Sphingomonas phyllosphaerae]